MPFKIGYSRSAASVLLIDFNDFVPQLLEVSLDVVLLAPVLLG
jgi:hypothetical protein